MSAYWFAERESCGGEIGLAFEPVEGGVFDDEVEEGDDAVEARP